MLVRALRIVLRIIGWLLIPLVVTATGYVGAALGFLIAGSWSVPLTAAFFALGCGLVGALVGCLVWIRLLRTVPALREALAVTDTGLPEPEAVHEILQAVALEDKPVTEKPPT